MTLPKTSSRVFLYGLVLVLALAGCGSASGKVAQDPGATAPDAVKLSQAQVDQIHANLHAAKKKNRD